MKCPCRIEMPMEMEMETEIEEIHDATVLYGIGHVTSCQGGICQNASYATYDVLCISY